MKHIIYIILIIISALSGYWIGQQTWIFDTNNKPHYFNTEEARLQEVKYCNAIIEGLHWYYRQDTVKWNNEFKNTKEFKNIELINNGDWEDFYAPNWK